MKPIMTRIQQIRYKSNGSDGLPQMWVGKGMVRSMRCGFILEVPVRLPQGCLLNAKAANHPTQHTTGKDSPTEDRDASKQNAKMFKCHGVRELSRGYSVATGCWQRLHSFISFKLSDYFTINGFSRNA